MQYVFDTNILVFYIKDKETKRYIEQTYSPFITENEVIISIVSVGELRAVALKNRWGNKRMRAVRELIQKMIIVEIKYDELIDYYAELDTYSQGKMESVRSKFTARNMGKNDLWIAATTKLVQGTLVTADNDFDHLDEVYFPIKKIKNLD